jgi:hypothetical protein
VSDSNPRPPSSKDAAGGGGKDKPLPADNIDTKAVMDGSSGSSSTPGPSDNSKPASPKQPSENPGRQDASRPDEPKNSSDKNPASTSDKSPKSDSNKEPEEDSKNKSGKQSGKKSGKQSGKKAERGPRGSKDSKKPETKGEQRAGKAGKAAGKEAGKAAGASVAGPAGAAVGEKIGEKVGEELGKRAFRKIKKRLALFTSLMMVFLMLVMGLVGSSIALGSKSSNRVSRDIKSSVFLNTKPIDAMRKAVLSASTDARFGGEIPWGLLAGVSIVSTELGKLSPYPEDLCDRDPERKSLRAKTGLSAKACGDTSPKVFPVVTPPIGTDQDTRGQGPYLLMPSGVPDDINLQSFSASGSSATVFMVNEIDRIRREMVDKEGWVLSQESSEDEFVSFWGTVMSRLPLADPTATTCSPPVLPDKTDANTIAIAIAQVWRCRLSSSVFYHYDSSKNLVSQGSIDSIVREALKVSYAWGQYGTSNNGLPPGCQIATSQKEDGTSTTSVQEIPNVPLAGVFPISKEIFDKHKSAEASSRCSHGDNILASLEAFLSQESLTWDQRSGSDGERIAGGWSKMPWSLGDVENIDDLYKNGPLLSFDPYGKDKACADALGVWVDSLKNSRALDKAAGILLSSSADGTPLELAQEWSSIKSAMSSNDPRSRTGPCRGRTDGSVERYAASVAYDRQVVKELLLDDHSSHDASQSAETPDVDPLAPIEPIDPIDAQNPVETPTTPPPPTPSADDISYAGTRSVLEFLARQSSSDAQVEATAGKDSLILRASPNGRDYSGVPYPAIPSSGRLLTIVKIARVLSGLWSQDPMFNPEMTAAEIDSALQEALPSFSPGGISVGSVPYVLLDASQKAAVSVKKWFPQCTADAALLLGVAWTESRGSWTTIGPDGNMNPRMVHGGSISSPPVDNDNGFFDQDPLDDHAVGAFGSAPGTWIGWKWKKSGDSWIPFPGRESIDAQLEATWADAGYGKGSDGNNDGFSDPNNVYDAAIATIRNVCAGRGGLDLVNWSEDFIEAFGVYAGGSDWNSRTETRTCYRLPPILALKGNPNDIPSTELVEVTNRECSEVLIRMKWEKAQEFRAMLSGAASFTSGPSSAGVMTVPPELLTHGNGKLPPQLLTPIGIGNEALYGPAATAFIAMRQAAKSAGVELWMTGSYRSYEGQVSCARRKGTSDQNQWLIQNNEPIPPVALPNGWCAVPGRSNHGWGLAIDIGHDSYPCSQGSPCWLWMIDNAQRYGWCDTGGGPREPWHWQYVGSGKCSGLFGSKPPR